jgi:hypothetical protein
MWCDLPVTVFDVMPVFDSLMASRMSQVCKAWRHNILKIERFRMVLYIRLHDTTGEDDIDIYNSISKNYKKLKRTNWVTAQRAFANYVYNWLGFNFWSIQEYIGRYFTGTKLLLRETCLYDLLVLFGYYGEDSAVFKDKITGDIIIVNNFKYTYHNKKEHEQFRDLHQLEKLFPGVITWKFIIISTDIGFNDKFRQIDFWTIHRNGHIVVRIKSNGMPYVATKFSKGKLLSDSELDAVIKLREVGKRRKLMRD